MPRSRNAQATDLGPAEDQPRVRVWMGRDEGSLTASVWGAASPADTRRYNLSRVTTVLDAASVPYFRVPGAPAQRTRLAVPASWRARALAALARSAEMAGAELRGVTGEQTRGRVPLREAPVAEAFWTWTNPDRTMVLADEYACDVEFWTEADGYLVCPRKHGATPPVPRDSPVLFAAEPEFDQFCRTDDRRRYPTRRELLISGMDWVRFPIDAVYTWVDGADPRWQRRKSRALAANGWVKTQPQAANQSRYLSRDELRYSLRSLYYFAPWIRRVFLVTDAQSPSWLDLDSRWITLVDHREILGGVARLPTFNSHAIETRLHHIPGLSEHFLYFNDDVFLGRPQLPHQYFLPNGLAKFFPSQVPVEAGPVRPDDPPIMSAGKNNREIITAQFGRLLTRKMKHTPHPQRRSVLLEIEQRCAHSVRATSQHEFRHPGDISVAASLQHYWSYLTGRAVPGDLEYQYADLNHPMTPIRLMNLLRHRHRDVFCLNDTDSSESDQREQALLLETFLPAYFPFRAPFERTAAEPERPIETTAPSQSRGLESVAPVT